MTPETFKEIKTEVDKLNLYSLEEMDTVVDTLSGDSKKFGTTVMTSLELVVLVTDSTLSFSKYDHALLIEGAQHSMQLARILDLLDRGVNKVSREDINEWVSAPRDSFTEEEREKLESARDLVRALMMISGVISQRLNNACSKEHDAYLEENGKDVKTPEHIVNTQGTIITSVFTTAKISGEMEMAEALFVRGTVPDNAVESIKIDNLLEGLGIDSPKEED